MAEVEEGKVGEADGLTWVFPNAEGAGVGCGVPVESQDVDPRTNISMTEPSTASACPRVRSGRCFKLLYLRRQRCATAALS